MRVQFTCDDCGSSVEVYPKAEAKKVQCEICQHEKEIHFNQDHENGILKDCPSCLRKDFYSQKDFNRKIGVLLFCIAAVASIWTYGMSLVALWLLDLFLFRKLKRVAACYKCNTLFRDLSNMEELHDYNHEMHDRIVYSDQDFKGEQLEH